MSLGRDSQTSGNESLSFGPNAQTSGNNSISIGRESQTSGADSMSLGYNSDTSGNFSMSLGRDSQTSGNESLSFGPNAQTSGNNSIALGRQSQTSSDNSISIGRESQTSSTGSISIGWNANSSSVNSIALGTDIVANQDDGFFVRHNSIAGTGTIAAFINDQLVDSGASIPEYGTLSVTNGLTGTDVSFSSNQYTGYYLRIGNVVTMSCFVIGDITISATPCSMELTLPAEISTIFSNNTSVAGVVNTNSQGYGVIQSMPGESKILFSFQNMPIGVVNFPAIQWHCTYIL